MYEVSVCFTCTSYIVTYAGRTVCKVFTCWVAFLAYLVGLLADLFVAF